MTVTPTISVFGILDKSGASASKRNLLTPTGTGPTRRESRTWSCSVLVNFGQQCTRKMYCQDVPTT